MSRKPFGPSRAQSTYFVGHFMFSFLFGSISCTQIVRMEAFFEDLFSDAPEAIRRLFVLLRHFPSSKSLLAANLLFVYCCALAIVKFPHYTEIEDLIFRPRVDDCR